MRRPGGRRIPYTLVIGRTIQRFAGQFRTAKTRFREMNRSPMLCYVSFSPTSDCGVRRRSMVEEFGIDDDRGRGGAGRATSNGGRGDPEAYGAVDDHYEKERRELVVGLHDELANQYLPRSVWLTERSRKKVESFLRMSEELCSEFFAEIKARGYPRVKHSMERFVSKKLRPLNAD